MAKVQDKEQLVKLIERSRLVPAERLREQLEEIRAEQSKLPRNADELAESLIESGLINRWQADNLLKGKYKGFHLGKYKLRGHLGTGGMSSVYLAEHPVMERLVAIKVLPKRYVEDQNYLDRFKREARAVAALDHPNIVRAFDIDQDGSTHYIVMEFVEGSDLAKLVKKNGPLDPDDAADFIAQSALGLHHAHLAGLVHRDVKPANCLVDQRRCVKLLDMGLAKFSEDDRAQLSSVYDDSIVGTADYLAPEQARNSQTVDARADVYSLGCTLYFLLTGQPPFPEGSIAQRLMKHQTETPRSIYDLRPTTPHFLVELCARMMIKDREQRIQTAEEVANEVRRWLHSRGKRISFDRAPAPDTGDSGLLRGGRSRFASPPAALPRSGDSGFGRGPRPDDTVTGSGDTSKKLTGSSSSLNDNLQLAPIDETTAKTESSGLLDDDAAPATASAESSSIDDLDLDRFGSGPLDALLDDPKFKRPNLPRRTLSKPEDTGLSSTAISVIVGIMLGAAALAILFFATR